MFPFKLEVNLKKIYNCFVNQVHLRSPAIPGHQRGKYTAYSPRCKSLFYFSFDIFLLRVDFIVFFDDKDALNGSL
jgi:hypothetical protein